MTLISRFLHIKKHRIFQTFEWNNELENFERYNLIYGWNGAGKSTLSNLFRLLERKESLDEGSAEVLIDDKVYRLNAAAEESLLPQVRVFNRQFITANVFATDTAASDLAPIYFLGEDSVEKEKRIQTLQSELLAEGMHAAAKNENQQQGERSLETFCIERARQIKLLLSASGVNPYNNYNKAIFKNKCNDHLKLKDAQSWILTDQRYSELLRQKESQSKPTIDKLFLSDSALPEFSKRIKELLAKTVVSKTIQALLENKAVAAWVEDGLALHTGDHLAKRCRFCDEEISGTRVADLRNHFNDAYKKLLKNVDDEHSKLNAALDKVRDLHIPDRAALYEHLQAQYDDETNKWNLYLQTLREYGKQLLLALSNKRKQIFEEVSLEPYLENAPPPDWASGKDSLHSINGLIEKHNQQTKEFDKSVATARQLLEDHEVVTYLDEYKINLFNIGKNKKELEDHKKRANKIRDEIESLKLAIEEHRRPAAELNEELKNYLGHDQLRFQIKDSGYVLTRDGAIAANLSEGEKTAIAFLYFLKSLSDIGFKLSNGIVVIDDPVSSLDSNALFSAFAFMKERTKGAKQLFILTHNFALFREVKHWFHNLRGQDRKNCRFYMLEPYFEQGHRHSRLAPLDRLLREHESEYHYLFQKIHREANRKGSRDLADFYAMPNLARRLVESFLAFRYPASPNMLNQMESSSFDPTKRTRLYRFLNAYSHRNLIEDYQHDLTLLSETPQILLDLLEFIETEDKRHYDQMLKVITTL